MAAGYAKATGRIGVCLATSGPGGLHLLNGLYDAKLDHAPVLAITGMQETAVLGTGHQQEVHLDRVLMDVADYNVMITAPASIPSLVDRAMRTSLARRTVSHLTFPNDLQVAPADAEPWPSVGPARTPATAPTFLGARSVPDAASLDHAAQVLNQGSKIAMLVGTGAIGAREEVLAVAELLASPIINTLPGKAAVPDDHPLTTGGLGLLGTKPSEAAVHESDTLLMVGTNFPYTAHLPEPGQARTVQIDNDPVRAGNRMPTEVPLVGDAAETLRALLPLLERKADRGFLEQAQDPHEPPLPGKIEFKQAKGFAEAFLRGQPDKLATARTLIKDQVDKLRGSAPAELRAVPGAGGTSRSPGRGGRRVPRGGVAALGQGGLNPSRFPVVRRDHPEVPVVLGGSRCPGRHPRQQRLRDPGRQELEGRVFRLGVPVPAHRLVLPDPLPQRLISLAEAAKGAELAGVQDLLAGELQQHRLHAGFRRQRAFEQLQPGLVLTLGRRIGRRPQVLVPQLPDGEELAIQGVELVSRGQGQLTLLLAQVPARRHPGGHEPGQDQSDKGHTSGQPGLQKLEFYLVHGIPRRHRFLRSCTFY